MEDKLKAALAEQLGGSWVELGDGIEVLVRDHDELTEAEQEAIREYLVWVREQNPVCGEAVGEGSYICNRPRGHDGAHMHVFNPEGAAMNGRGTVA